MTQQDAFVQAIIESPEDDTPRLIFADWLEDHDQPERAEFIRSQIERAQLPAGDLRQVAMEKREHSLLRRFARRWFAPPRGWKAGLTYLVRRGFPETLHVDAKTLLLRADDLFARWPITRLLRPTFWGTPELARRLAEASFLARIRDLDLYYLHLGREIMSILLGSPHLGNLVRLHVGSNLLGDAGARDLVRSPQLAGLHDLDVSHNDITDTGLRQLIRCKHFRSIRSLSLCGNQQFGVEAVLSLLRSHNWPALTDLNLWATALGDKGVRQLARSPALAKLTSLNLNNNAVSNLGLKALAESPYSANLRSLSLAVNVLGGAAAADLMASPYLQGLTYLCLHNNAGIVWQTRRRLREHFGARVTFDEPW
jgi:uncharacterized protein (TIGR02996 family)